MTQGNRIKLLRKELNISQEKFGFKIGLSKVAISDIENGKTSLTERNAKAICREFKVDYFWLTEGVGEMFTHFEELIINEVTELYNLDKTEKAIVLAYLEADKETKKTIEKFIIDMAEKIKNTMP